MNAHVQINYPELIAALDYERKQSAELERKLSASEKSKLRYKANFATEQMRNRILESKLDKLGYKHVGGVSDEDEKKIVIDMLADHVMNCKDGLRLMREIVRLRDVDKFWRVVKTQNINAITTILTGMKTQEGFDLVLSKIKDK
jgi:hypothetical protein